MNEAFNQRAGGGPVVVMRLSDGEQGGTPRLPRDCRECILGMNATNTCCWMRRRATISGLLLLSKPFESVQILAGINRLEPFSTALLII